MEADARFGFDKAICFAKQEDYYVKHGRQVLFYFETV